MADLAALQRAQAEGRIVVRARGRAPGRRGHRCAGCGEAIPAGIRIAERWYCLICAPAAARVGRPGWLDAAEREAREGA